MLRTLPPRIPLHKPGNTPREKRTTTQLGLGSAWRRRREEILHRDGGLCQVCAQSGIVKSATEVDHKCPREQGGGDNDENLQSICRECHEIKTAQENRARQTGET